MPLVFVLHLVRNEHLVLLFQVESCLALCSPLGFYYICNFRSNLSLPLPADPARLREILACIWWYIYRKRKRKIWYLQWSVPCFYHPLDWSFCDAATMIQKNKNKEIKFCHLFKSTRGHCLHSFSHPSQRSLEKAAEKLDVLCGASCDFSSFSYCGVHKTRNVIPAWFFISQAKPLLPVFCTFCVNRICIIK